MSPFWGFTKGFKREFDKLGMSEVELVDFRAVLDEYASGHIDPKRIDHVRNGIYELRISGHRRIFRVLFFRPKDGPCVAVALTVFRKTTQQLRDTDIKRAEKRQKAWVRDH